MHSLFVVRQAPIIAIILTLLVLLISNKVSALKFCQSYSKMQIIILKIMFLTLLNVAWQNAVFASSFQLRWDICFIKFYKKTRFYILYYIMFCSFILCSVLLYYIILRHLCIIYLEMEPAARCHLFSVMRRWRNYNLAKQEQIPICLILNLNKWYIHILTQTSCRPVFFTPVQRTKHSKDLMSRNNFDILTWQCNTLLRGPYVIYACKENHIAGIRFYLHRIEWAIFSAFLIWNQHLETSCKRAHCDLLGGGWISPSDIQSLYLPASGKCIHMPTIKQIWNPVCRQLHKSHRSDFAVFGILT